MDQKSALKLQGESPASPPPPSLLDLPNELIDNICFNLCSALDLVSLASTCRRLYAFLHDDRYWARFINNILPHPIPTPSPSPTFFHLYRSRHPFWYLLQRRFFFSDDDATGKFVITRYNRRTAGIEAYNIVIPRPPPWHRDYLIPWAYAPDVSIAPYSPDLQLWFVDPVVVIDGDSALRMAEDARRREVLRRGDVDIDLEIAMADALPGTRMPSTIPWRGMSIPMHFRSQGGAVNMFILGEVAREQVLSEGVRVEDETDGNGAGGEAGTGTDNGNGMGTSMSSAAGEPVQTDILMRKPDVWPPTTIPAADSHRVSRNTPYMPPQRGSRLSQYGFHTRRWVSFGRDPYPAGSLEFGLGGLASFGVSMERSATWASLDEEVYTPSAEKPLQGIWVGDYGLHGSEILVFMHGEEEGEGENEREADGDGDVDEMELDGEDEEEDVVEYAEGEVAEDDPDELHLRMPHAHPVYLHRHLGRFRDVDFEPDSPSPLMATTRAPQSTTRRRRNPVTRRTATPVLNILNVNNIGYGNRNIDTNAPPTVSSRQQQQQQQPTTSPDASPISTPAVPVTANLNPPSPLPPHPHPPHFNDTSPAPYSPVMIPPSSPSPAAAATLEPVPLPRTGSLRAVKLTGDPNVPRGEVSFEIPRLSVGRRSTRRRNGKQKNRGSSSKGGLLRIETESPFNGCPVFRGYGHVAEDGFRRCSVLPVQVVLVSVDHVAVWWEDLRKVAYFRRVDLEELWRR